jgi:hypothetical protein
MVHTLYAHLHLCHAAVEYAPVLHVVRLACTCHHLPADVDGPSAGTPPTGGTGPATAQQPGSNLMQVEPVTQSDDTWVTVFGFSPDDLALVLQASRCCVSLARIDRCCTGCITATLLGLRPCCISVACC